MKNVSKFLKSFALISLILPTFLMADDEGHVPVGTRQMSPDASAQMELNQAAEGAGEESQPSTTCNEKEEARCGFIYDRYPPVYYPNTYHWLIAVSALGDQVEFEDGSVWKINSYDGYKALNWRSNDPLTITQNSRWFSSYTYKIINKNTGTSIEANLFLGPIKNGEYTRYILAIDPTRGEVMLTDSTHWEVSSGDSYVFRDWAINDSIILGSNTGWDSSCEAILINVTMNNFVRAKQF